MAKIATFFLSIENTSTDHVDNLILMLNTTKKDTKDAKHALQGIISTPRYPTDSAIYPMQKQITTKHPISLFIILKVVICYQHTVNHQNLYFILLTFLQLPGTF